MRKFLVLLVALTYAGIFSASAVQAQHVTKISASQLVTNGESFFQASNITSELTRLARADGYIGSSESFKCVAVSGAPIASIVNFYKNCNPKPVYLVSDGAGIDLMSGNCTDENCATIKNCKNTLLTYIEEMKKGGTKKLLWMIYPDPQGGSWATLKKNQDIWAKVVPAVMATVTVPKVLLVDLRPVWAGHYSQYTSDGIHATSAGGTATAEAFWKAMKENYFFDLDDGNRYSGPLAIARSPSSLLGQVVGNGQVLVSLSLNQPSNVVMHLTTVSGRSVFTAQQQVSTTGLQTVQFPLGAIAPGMYCCEVTAGQLATQSTLLVQ